jgi:predicted ATP-binding protein involved in virulence
MSISSVKVLGLFGYFDHNITFHTEDRITILHGPNGVGKTTILRLLRDIFSGRLIAVRRIPFKRIVIQFIPKGVLTIIQSPNSDSNNFPNLSLTYRHGQDKVEYTLKSLKDKELGRKYPVSIIERLIDQLERVGADEWFDQSSGDYLSMEDVVFKYGDLLPDEFRNIAESLPIKIQEVLKDTSVYLIETQRLFTKSPFFTKSPQGVYDSRRRIGMPRERMTVEEYSSDMVSNVQQLLGESGALSSSLDRDFPRRLLETPLPKEASEEKIRERYAEQNEYRDRLMRTGLMKPEQQVPLPTGELNEIERKVLWVYLTDVERKLRVFDALLRKAELLREIINSRFLYKSFSFDPEAGFLFTSNHDQSQVPLKSLSSGEQHELVLAYELLFKVKKKALVMIDEPELSLHVTWQRKFLEDIDKISGIADLDFLIATHSPSIINDRRDLMIGLGGDI